MQRIALLALILLLCPVLHAESVGRPLELSDRVSSGDRFMGIRLLGILDLRGSPVLAELSALAWDEDEQILYGLTDRGVLLHLNPLFRRDRLAGLDLMASYPLLGPRGRPLTGNRRDSEGLTLEHGDNGRPGDSRLLVSFEQRHRVARYTAQGRYLGQIPLPSKLNDRAFYTNSNTGLEALTLHPRFGLMTGPEKTADDGPIPIYSEQGRHWLYQPLEPEGALVAMEALDNGEIIVLERAYDFPFRPWVISLSRVHPTEDNTGSLLKADLLARFDSSEGWRVHNFEGLTRHRGNRFFMVSDNGGSSLLQSQLLYFEIL